MFCNCIFSAGYLVHPFNWQTYLEHTNSTAAADSLFTLVMLLTVIDKKIDKIVNSTGVLSIGTILVLLVHLILGKELTFIIRESI